MLPEFGNVKAIRPGTPTCETGQITCWLDRTDAHGRLRGVACGG
jgi:hypothetical protein